MDVKEMVILRPCGKVNIMIIIWLLLITTIQNQEANKIDDNDTFQVLNVTTLYPVSKKIKYTPNNTSKTLEGRTSWKLEATYGETNLENKTDGIQEEKGTNITIAEQEAREIINNKTTAEEKAREINDCKDFKPSQHLGSFFDDHDLTYGGQGNVEEPGIQFVSFHKNEYNTGFIPSPEEIQVPKELPYKFDSTIYRTKDIYSHDILEARPTVEVPVRVPAGGLYKLEDPFAVHPSVSHSGFNDEYGLEINENLKEHHIKKRMNPWRSVLRLVTALVPAGLIISALTPSVISIRSTGPEARYRSRFVRRSDTSGLELPTISEQCRRRLLCELYSEDNYKKSQLERHKGTHCYKIHCEDPQAVWRMLHWLLTYHQPRSNDERGRYFT